MSLILEIDGTRRPLTSWGVTSCTVEVANMLRDVLTFRVPVADLTPAPAIAQRGQLVRLFANGICVFVGLMREPKPVVTDAEIARIYRVEGLGYWLDRVLYRQHWRVPAEDPGTYVTPATEMAEPLVSAVVLFRNYDDGTKVTLSNQLRDALSQAKAKLAADGLDMDFSLSYVPSGGHGDQAGDVEPPEDEKRDLSVLDVLESCLRWAPYLACRADYSSGTPVIRFSSAPAMTPGGVRIPGGTVRGQGLTIRAVRPADLVTCDPKPLDDRLVKRLTVSYLVTNQETNGDGETYVWRSVDTDVSEVDNGAIGEISITIPLRGLIYDGSSYTAPEPKPPQGLAVALHQAFARVWWEFTLGFVDQAPRWGLKIGDGWNLQQVGPATEAGEDGPDHCASITQRIVWDVMEGSTQVFTGAPTHLGADDLITLLMANRLRNVPSRAGEQQLGFAPIDKQAQQEDSGEGLQPFDVYFRAGNFHVKRGQLCGVAPTIVTGLGGGTEDYRFTAIGNGVIFLKVVIDGATNGVTTRELYYAPSMPAAGSAGGLHTGYLELATVTMAEGVWSIVQAYNGSRWASVIIYDGRCTDDGLIWERDLIWS